jgi:hypothetical protein
MKAKGWEASKMQITRMFDNSPFVVADRNGTQLMISDYISILFGVNADMITNELLTSIYIAISDRFIGIRAHDIQEAFRVAVIEKKPYVSISRDEVLEPIFTYWRKKQFILSAIKDLESVEIENQEAILKAERFKSEAMDVFYLSIHNKKWTGTPFQAYIIAPTIADKIDAELKKTLWKEAQIEFKQNRLNPLYDPSNPLNENRIYSQKIMIYYCENIEI